MSGELHNKVALVTGGATGIGRAITEELVRQEAKVTPDSRWSASSMPAAPIRFICTVMSARKTSSKRQ